MRTCAIMVWKRGRRREEDGRERVVELLDGEEGSEEWMKRLEGLRRKREEGWRKGRKKSE